MHKFAMIEAISMIDNHKNMSLEYTPYLPLFFTPSDQPLRNLSRTTCYIINVGFRNSILLHDVSIQSGTTSADEINECLLDYYLLNQPNEAHPSPDCGHRTRRLQPSPPTCLYLETGAYPFISINRDNLH